jgi:hypothetical protein
MTALGVLVLGELDAYQLAAVGATLDAQPPGRGDLLREQVVRHSREVVASFRCTTK